jgi:hypothetical protein
LIRRSLAVGVTVTAILVSLLVLDRLGYTPNEVSSLAATLLFPAKSLGLRWGNVSVFYTPYSASPDGAYRPGLLLDAPGFWFGLIITVELYSAITYGVLCALGRVTRQDS